MLRETYRHSASSATTYATRPSEWLARYGFGLYGEDTARTAMGRAAEHGCAMALLHDLTDDEGAALAIREFDQLMKGEVTEEREASGRIARRFLAQLRPLGRPQSYQEETIVKGERFGLRYPIKIVTDFRYEDLIVDTKATLRCPTACGIREAKHVLQVSCYGRIAERAAALLYCSPSRTFFHVPGSEDLRRAGRRCWGSSGASSAWISSAPRRRTRSRSSRSRTSITTTPSNGHASRSFGRSASWSRKSRPS
jgi:hypothetical protein